MPLVWRWSAPASRASFWNTTKSMPELWRPVSTRRTSRGGRGSAAGCVRADTATPGQADRVHADHDAGPAGGEHEIVVVGQAGDVVGDVERVHRHAAGAVGYALEDVHHLSHAFGQRQAGRIGLQLVVLDEVDTGIGRARRPGRRAPRAESPMLGFTIVPINGPARSVDQLTGAGHAEPRARVHARRRPPAARGRPAAGAPTSRSSNRLPATAARRLGSDGPKLRSGKSILTRARRADRQSPLAPGRGGRPLGGSSSMAATMAACRALQLARSPARPGRRFQRTAHPPSPRRPPRVAVRSRSRRSRVRRQTRRPPRACCRLPSGPWVDMWPCMNVHASSTAARGVLSSCGQLRPCSWKRPGRGGQPLLAYCSGLVGPGSG